MTVLERVYASGGDIIISTIELTCNAWAESVFICNGFENQTCTDEDSRVINFQAAGISISLPKKDNSGAQSLMFAIDNITGESQALIDQAIEAEERVFLTFRCFLASDKSTPAERPYYMTVISGTVKGTAIQIQAGFYDLLNTMWPRNVLSTSFAPGLKYL